MTNDFYLCHLRIEVLVFLSSSSSSSFSSFIVNIESRKPRKWTEIGGIELD